MRESLEVVRRHRDAGTLFGPDGKVTDAVLGDLGTAGYWGLLIDPQYGGQGAPFAAFSRFLTQMATIEPTLAGLASVHGCIGAVDPLRTFGSPEQKAQYLPLLASGRKLSAFALTEPGAGSDLTALRTTAELDGDDYVVNGEKLFITNAVPGPDDRTGLPDRKEARGADRRPARPRGRALPARPLRPARAAAPAQQRPAVPRLPRTPRRTCSARRRATG